MEQEKTSDNEIIAKINDVDIFCLRDEKDILVPIKPICTALGLNYSAQVEKLRQDDRFNATIPLRGTVGADGKQRLMMCMPLMFVFLWLGNINPKNVSETARPVVKKYALECAKALFDHFAGNEIRRTKEDKREREILVRLKDKDTEIQNAELHIKSLRSDRTRINKELEKVREERLNMMPTLPFE